MDACRAAKFPRRLIDINALHFVADSHALSVGTLPALRIRCVMRSGVVAATRGSTGNASVGPPTAEKNP